MYGRAIKLSLAIAVFGTTPAIGAEKISFQGIDGHSSIRDVRAQFPTLSAEKPAECRIVGGIELDPKLPWRCEILVDHSYVISTNVYRLAFRFYPSGNVAKITIGISAGMKFSAERYQHLSKDDLLSIYFELSRILNLRYGDSSNAEEYCTNTNTERQLSICDTWRQMGSKMYSTVEPSMTLNALAWKKPDSSDFYGNVAINYSFPDYGSAGKF